MAFAILSIQARVLLWVGLLALGIGLWRGVDPLTASWRAALAGVGAMVVTGRLLGIAGDAINDRLASELAERELAAKAEAKAAASKAKAAPAMARAGEARRR